MVWCELNNEENEIKSLKLVENSRNLRLLTGTYFFLETLLRKPNLPGMSGMTENAFLHLGP